ncbi:hypothetical protein QAD02_014671 [Eretmocerus hayati]|uniref:Uncharacterized protein n=2 Tax=Eretmocerus hayati TaxID=131215 RepID=A0ACC2P6I2_9HYME|nr:hypothetical protein QAD02_005467 [Eretmocerus hayati]KAJ8678884.1 hypothetical protein QAD02_014671 [Eretmocerus hayati]
MADKDIRNLLRSLGLEDLIDSFKKNNITQASLKMLDRTMIDELIKDIGYRAVFLDYWSKNICVTPKNPVNRNTNNATQKIPNECSAKHYTFRSIDEILNENTEGKRVLDFYTSCKKLKNKHRNRLCHSLLEEAEKNNLRVDNDVAHFLAVKVVQRFNGEVLETYFKAPVKKCNSTKNKSEPAAGKLITIRNNRKTRETSHQKTLKNDKGHHKENENQPISNNAVKIVVTEKIRIANEWLSNNQAPWKTVLEHWETGSPLRLEEILALDSDDLSEIFAKWELYKHPSGSELIKIDFKYGKFSKIVITYDLWMEFITIVRQHADLNESDNILYEYLKLVDSTDEETGQGEKVAASLMALAHLVPPKFSKKFTRKEGYKPSVRSAKGTMVQNVSISGDLSRVRAEVVEQAAKRREKIQPYIIIVGELEAISDIYVNVDNVLYQVSSVLEAIDICFKVFFVFHLQFPYDSQHLWLMIQRGVYGITTDYDSEFPFMSHILDKLIKPTDASAKSTTEKSTAGDSRSESPNSVHESNDESDRVETEVNVNDTQKSHRKICSTKPKKSNRVDSSDSDTDTQKFHGKKSTTKAKKPNKSTSSSNDSDSEIKEKKKSKTKPKNTKIVDPSDGDESCSS